MAIQIKKGVALPPAKEKTNLSDYAKALLSMEIGDSFEFEEEAELKKIQAAVATARKRSKETLHFSIRQLPDIDGLKMRGVWRVAEKVKKIEDVKEEKAAQSQEASTEFAS